MNNRWSLCLSGWILCVLTTKMALLIHLMTTQSKEPINEPRRRLARKHNDAAVAKPRIIGGSPAGQVVPFLVALYKSDDPNSFLPACAGTLITPSLVLTAGHCIADIQSAQIGRYDYTQSEPNVESYVELERRIHPSYDDSTFDFDYALIKLDRPQPDAVLVQLVRSTELPSGEDLRIMGWGKTEEEGSQSQVLLDALVERFDQDECQENYEPEPVTENMFCANNDGPTDACQGDSGGPILLAGTNRQLGLTSWGIDCGNATFPGVYARMSSGIDWIEEMACTELVPDECTDDMRLPLVNEEGAIIPQSCDDYDSDFLGLGKKLKMRNCDWVNERKGLRCKWYHEYCPATCQLSRCN